MDIMNKGNVPVVAAVGGECLVTQKLSRGRKLTGVRQFSQSCTIKPTYRPHDGRFYAPGWPRSSEDSAKGHDKKSTTSHLRFPVNAVSAGFDQTDRVHADGGKIWIARKLG